MVSRIGMAATGEEAPVLQRHFHNHAVVGGKSGSIDRDALQPQFPPFLRLLLFKFSGEFRGQGKQHVKIKGFVVFHNLEFGRVLCPHAAVLSSEGDRQPVVENGGHIHREARHFEKIFRAADTYLLFF